MTDKFREIIAKYFESKGAPLKAEWVREGVYHEIYMADVMALLTQVEDAERDRCFAIAEKQECRSDTDYNAGWSQCATQISHSIDPR